MSAEYPLLKYKGRSAYICRNHWYRVRAWNRGKLGVWAYVYSSGVILDVMLYSDMGEFWEEWKMDPRKGTHFEKKGD